jgi:hypothetical protein
LFNRSSVLLQATMSNILAEAARHTPQLSHKAAAFESSLSFDELIDPDMGSGL